MLPNWSKWPYDSHQLLSDRTAFFVSLFTVDTVISKLWPVWWMMKTLLLWFVFLWFCIRLGLSLFFCEMLIYMFCIVLHTFLLILFCISYWLINILYECCIVIFVLFIVNMFSRVCLIFSLCGIIGNMKVLHVDVVRFVNLFSTVLFCFFWWFFVSFCFVCFSSLILQCIPIVAHSHIPVS